MALEANDLMVVQKASGAQEIRKATMQQLSDFLQTSDTVAYKGLANFTQTGEEPTTKNVGDLYINNALADGTWAWAAGVNSGGVTDVSPGDRAIWNGAQWDVIQSGAGDVGVTEVQGTLPIIVTDGDTDTPVVSVREATTVLDGVVARLATNADVNASTGTGSTTAVVTADLLKETNSTIESLDTGVTTVTASEPLSITGGDAAAPNVESRQTSTTESGHVARLATAADVAKDGTGDANAVVTADLLKQTNIGLDAATAGGLTSLIGVDPIEVTTDNSEGEGSSTTTPAVAIKDSAVGQKGAIAILDDGTSFGDPADSDYAAWAAGQDHTEAMTARVTAKNFVYADFSALADA